MKIDSIGPLKPSRDISINEQGNFINGRDIAKPLHSNVDNGSGNCDVTVEAMEQNAVAGERLHVGNQ